MTATIIGLALAALALSAFGEGEASPAATEDDTKGPAVVIRDHAFEPETLRSRSETRSPGDGRTVR
jgi:hypothetical protein